MKLAAIGRAILAPVSLQERTLRWAAPLVTLLAVLALLGALWGAWQAIDWWNDRQAVKHAADKANADFGQRKDAVTGAADVASAGRRQRATTEIKRTEELIDEALEKGCVVADYLDSAGADCVRPPAAVPGAAAQ